MSVDLLGDNPPHTQRGQRRTPNGEPATAQVLVVEYLHSLEKGMRLCTHDYRLVPIMTTCIHTLAVTQGIVPLSDLMLLLLSAHAAAVSGIVI